MKKTKGLLRIGDEVEWRGGWGVDAPKKKAIVTEIQTGCKGTKYGNNVTKVNWIKVTEDNVVVTLDNGHWAYGSQITEL